jgi:hypothetical protein
MNAIASFTEVTSDTLLVRNGASFYRLTPVKGARVEGTVSVGVTSHDVTVSGSHSWEPKRTVPAMWIDYTPSFEDRKHGSRELLTVNGREYGAGFGESVSGRVEFMPADAYEHLSKYYPSATVDGTKYYLRATINQFDSVTDKAREVLDAVASAIAAEYVTDERWHAYRVSQAEYAVARATEDRDKAQGKLDVALAELQALTA